MSLIHITGHVYAPADEIAKIEGFPQTLLIKVTLRDGTSHDRFVSEEHIAHWSTDEGVAKRVDLSSRYRRIDTRLYARDEAFKLELNRWVANINREIKPWSHKQQ